MTFHIPPDNPFLINKLEDEQLKLDLEGTDRTNRNCRYYLTYEPNLIKINR